MNTIDWGQAAVNNTIGFGQGAKIGGSSFSNTKSILLDGIDDFVTMGSVLDFGRTDAFSVSLWFKRTRTGVSEFLFSKSESSGNYRGYSVFFPADNRVLFYIGSTLSNRILLYSGNTITDTNWHNIVVTYSGGSTSSGMSIYIDGLDDTGTASGTLSTSIANLSSFEIGSRNGNLFSGNIDEAAVFNSELSQSDVSAIWNNGVPSSLSSYSSLVSWWRCGDGDTSPTLTDNGSGGNDGTMTNFTTFSTDVPTFNTKSILLDGIDDYVDCGNVTSLNGLANGSISMWFKTSNTAGQIFMAKWASGQQQFYAILFPNTRIDVYSETIGFRSTDTIALADGNWHHLAITLDGGLTGNQRFKVYVDATALTNLGFSGPTAFSTSTSDLLIGKRNAYGFSEWNGNLDEVSIFTKTLSASEITGLYNSGVPTNLSTEANLANWWRFEGTGTTATDSGTGGNNGTLTNGVIRSANVPT